MSTVVGAVQSFQHRDLFNFSGVVFLLQRGVENSCCAMLTLANLSTCYLCLFVGHPA